MAFGNIKNTYCITYKLISCHYLRLKAKQDVKIYEIKFIIRTDILLQGFYYFVIFFHFFELKVFYSKYLL